MSFNGAGVYTLPGAQLANGATVSATENNQFRNDVATALNVAWTRDGQAPATSDIPMGSHKLTGLANGTVSGDALHYGQIGVAVQAYDSDIPTVSASQAEMEAGTETALRSMSPLRVAQAISALAPTTFPSGTLMLFQQTSAPTGWTKQTTHNDKALRVVSGTASSGGSVGFSTAMGTPGVVISGLSAGATTLSTAQIPSHTHNTGIYYFNGSGSNDAPGAFGGPTIIPTSSSGGGGSHNHSISGSATATINVAYVDLIIASKD